TVLGVRMRMGRPILASEAVPGNPTPIAVISERLWRDMFGENERVIGQTIRANKTVLTVVGVVADGFQGIDRSSNVDVWTPFSMYAQLEHTKPEYFFERGVGTRYREVVGRLRPGVTAEAARADLQRILDGLIDEFPKENGLYKERPVGVYAGIGVPTISRQST